MSSSSSHDAAAPPDFTGLTIDRYELMAIAGTGAFGTVYVSRDTATAERVAIKCMVQAEEGTKAYEVQQDEIALHYAVHEHPNVVSFREHFAYQGYLFLVMEYVQGGAVVDALEHGVFEDKPELAKQAIFEMFDAVEHLHKNGVYHRDIKPDNILCNEDGSHFRLADFGLATTSRTTKRAGGTASYMPPESFDCTQKYHCPQVGDKWAVSVLFVALITGRYPWSAAKRDDRHYAAFLHDKDHHFRITLGLSTQVSDLLKRCFDEDASKRPTITEMRRELESIESFSNPSDCPKSIPQSFPASSCSVHPVIEFDSSDWDEDSESDALESAAPASPPAILVQIAVRIRVDDAKSSSSLQRPLHDYLAGLSIKAVESRSVLNDLPAPPTQVSVAQACT
ncbi:Protein kinase domain-containing protein [Mycena chlorophos]|uniref:Protein kinase domain-containing protein n=1 Tax=Mycena chlorophos TaxID=658473 RepID=A0A8H6S1K6_MYCCL|nr:Protein kinase domain-containing protein [Mycena chlorophos]